MFRQLKFLTSTLNDRRVYFDIRLTDGITTADHEAGNFPQVSVNGGSWDSTGISALVLIGFGKYYADLSPTIITDIGEIIETRYKGTNTQEVDGDTFIVVGNSSTSSPIPSLGEIISQSYCSVEEGTYYFNARLGSEPWDESTHANKLKALRTATRLIDRLAFKGIKSDSNQLLEFPRLYNNNHTNDTTNLIVPNDIKIACFEISLILLDGIDINAEISNLYIESQSLATSRIQYNRKIVPEHIRAGIPSAIAWEYLRPYLIDVRTLQIERVN